MTKSLEQPIFDTVELLKSKLGPTLVSAAIGLSNRDMIKSATSQNDLNFTDEQLIRIDFILEIWNKVANVEGDDVARLWFLGANPWLNEDSAISAIREDLFYEVRHAAKAMIEDTSGF